MMARMGHPCGGDFLAKAISRGPFPSMPGREALFAGYEGGPVDGVSGSGQAPEKVTQILKKTRAADARGKKEYC